MSEENKDKKRGRQAMKKPGCKRCGTRKGVISKYRIGICRRCFKEMAEDIGFRKYD
ncbi:MAG: 30S ribosomal protein S14 [Candidatus Diapherotrites archaeon]|nr:30S ribosomal protein S14 [Candidatus Micrarchaeota archaeon]MBU1939504.1 30S ribosomal protein S14 [Candidatus Micrarchaeota archaeon]